jgi:predicted metal-dependent HD superfamily phosphohydrolase
MSDLIHKAEQFVTDFYGQKINKDLLFHSLKHVQRTVKNVRLLAEESGLSPEDTEILLLAAWFHDTGHSQTYERHERRSAEIAREFLRQNEYPEEKIEKVMHCIWATDLAYKPKDLLEKVIRDADLLHLGKKNFFKRNQELREEWEKMLDKKYTDEEWLKSDIKFLTGHEFQTDYARHTYGEQKKANLMVLEKKLNRQQAGSSDASQLKKLEKNMAKKIKKEKTPDRGIETMFRVTSRNHFTLSSIADSKAGTLISISALIISIILSVLVRRLEEQPQLIIPTIMILITLLGTIIFAVLSTRPKVTSLHMSRDDIKQKKGNLLFFGNFINMSVQDYEWGMQELMEDRDYLYNNLIRDIYYLGLVLGKKYKYLRIAYNFFMYGLIVSVISYIISFTFV